MGDARGRERSIQEMKSHDRMFLTVGSVTYSLYRLMFPYGMWLGNWSVDKQLFSWVITT